MKKKFYSFHVFLMKVDTQNFNVFETSTQFYIYSKKRLIFVNLFLVSVSTIGICEKSVKDALIFVFHWKYVD